jgi:serine/threonine protein kinase
MDGSVMEQATKSRHVANIYGYCGVSQLVEYSEGGNLHDLIKVTRTQGQDVMAHVDKLKILIQIASSVTDIHDASISVSHNDLCCHQYLLVDGIYKLNDFTLGRFISESPENEVCGDESDFGDTQYSSHAPEELYDTPRDLTKSDVYMMGTVMYYVFTKHWLYEGFSSEESLNMLRNGYTSEFPHGIDMTSPINRAMESAIIDCWEQNPDIRPSAQSIRDYLLGKLSSVEGRKIGPDDPILRVAIPSLPEEYHFTDSDHEAYHEAGPIELKYATS